MPHSKNTLGSKTRRLSEHARVYEVTLMLLGNDCGSELDREALTGHLFHSKKKAHYYNIRPPNTVHQCDKMWAFLIVDTTALSCPCENGVNPEG